MSRILITGMSAPHTSYTLNRRAVTFAGLVEKVLKNAGHQVVLCEPDVSWERFDLEAYDAIFVGVSPLTSLSANNAYGALHIINLMASSDKLTLFIDAPNPSQIGASLRSIKSKPDQLSKEFYSYRKGYQFSKDPENLKRFMQVVDLLLDGEWPDTIYPSLPWRDIESINQELPQGVHSHLRGINLDSYMITRREVSNDERIQRWAADMPDSAWTKKTLKTLNYSAIPMKWHKGFSDEDITEKMENSIGSLIAPYKDGTWWTPRYAQSLTTVTPIASEWKETSLLGNEWNALAATIEHMNAKERSQVATGQRESYLSSVPNKETSRAQIEDLLKINGKVTA